MEIKRYKRDKEVDETSLFRFFFEVFSFIICIFGTRKKFLSTLWKNSNNNKTYLTMVDFSYHAPTEVVFGKNSEQRIAALVKKYGDRDCSMWCVVSYAKPEFPLWSWVG